MNIAKISRERCVLLAGPTASGKSALAMELAARDGRVIVNADALQVYGMWRVLTARPSAADEAALPHALFGHIGRDSAYSTGHWLREVAGLLARPVVIVGGTGLNFSALTKGLADIPATPAHWRDRANAVLASAGLPALLADLDARTKARIDTANPARVQRAWEVLRATGRGLADWQDETGPALLPLPTCEAVVINPDAAVLDGRIARRFDLMLQLGALDEVRAALPFWPAQGSLPFWPAQGSLLPPPAWARAIGAPELVAHLRGEMDLRAATAAAILASRQYAKRQRTWIRNQMSGWTVLGG